MASARDWLDAGLAILAEHGEPGLTIERLTEQLSLTKGSFYHHFGGMPGYKSALLEHFEAEFTTRFVDEVESAGGDARARLDRLLDLVLSDKRPDAEVAVRSWAMHDTEVRGAQERIDRTRIHYLQALWLEDCGDAAEADQMGRLLYLILIGANHAIPPVEGEDLRKLYERAMRRTEEDT